MKPKISLLFASFAGGGVYRVMTNLGLGLAEAGYPVDLVVGQTGGRPVPFPHPNLRVINLNRNGILRSIPALVKYLRTDRPAFMISAQTHVNIAAILACTLARTQTRLIVGEHIDIQAVYRNARSLKARWTPHFARWLYPLADQVLAVSHGAAASLAGWTGIPEAAIHVIYNPIVSERLFAAAKENLAHPWFAPGEPPVILAVGRLEKQKDYPALIDAFARLPDAIQARLLILGEGSLRGFLEEQIQDRQLDGRVELHGYSANPYAFMSHAALFVLSSSWEGYPTVIVEALACGCPVVSTDCPSGPAEILAEGRHGILVPVGDSAALADAIQSALRDPIRAPLDEVIEKNGIREVTAHYIRMLEETGAR